MNVGLWLERTAAATPTRPALYLGREHVADYGEFHDRAARLAGWMMAQGIRPGDRVAIFMSNTPDYLIVLYAIWYCGAAAVPVNGKLHGREVVFILNAAGAVMVFATPDHGRALAAAEPTARCIDVAGPEFAAALTHSPSPPRDRAPGDLAWLFYTSGTTGQPKGVMITHRMLIAMSLCYQTDVDVAGPEDTVLYAAPMSHGAGLYNMIHVRAGARHVCPVSGGFDAAEIFDLAGHFGNGQLFAAPTMVKRMCDAAEATGADGSGLRTVVYGGGPMYLADIVRAQKMFGAIFVQIYGQGECPMGITALNRTELSDRDHPNWRGRLASVGRAQSAVEIRIGDAEGAPLPPGEPGEIMVRGDTVMPGYWQDADASARALAGGWLRTGDVGIMDTDGYLTLRDRSKDLIISGGSNIYPREVEEVLLRHPDVAEASVVGRPHPDWGEEVVAFVVGDAPFSELDALCTRNIARFKRPKAYIPVPELPKNNYGKVLKTRLRRLLTEDADRD